MKINPMQQSNIVSHYMNNAAKVTSAGGKGSVPAADSVELSHGAQEYTALLRSARIQMDQAQREETERVGTIMEQMQRGDYQTPDDETLARAILGGSIPEYC